MTTQALAQSDISSGCLVGQASGLDTFGDIMPISEAERMILSRIVKASTEACEIQSRPNRLDALGAVIRFQQELIISLQSVESSRPEDRAQYQQALMASIERGQKSLEALEDWQHQAPYERVKFSVNSDPAQVACIAMLPDRLHLRARSGQVGTALDQTPHPCRLTLTCIPESAAGETAKDRAHIFFGRRVLLGSAHSAEESPSATRPNDIVLSATPVNLASQSVVGLNHLEISFSPKSFAIINLATQGTTCVSGGSGTSLCEAGVQQMQFDLNPDQAVHGQLRFGTEALSDPRTAIGLMFSMARSGVPAGDAALLNQVVRLIDSNHPEIQAFSCIGTLKHLPSSSSASDPMFAEEFHLVEGAMPLTDRWSSQDLGSILEIHGAIYLVGMTDEASLFVDSEPLKRGEVVRLLDGMHIQADNKHWVVVRYQQVNRRYSPASNEPEFF